MEPQSDLGYSDVDYSYFRGSEYSHGQQGLEERLYGGSASGCYEHPDLRRVKEIGPVPFSRNYSDPLPMPTRKQAPIPMSQDIKRNESTFVMDISPSVVGWIIGRSGIRIKEIQAQTGCKMWVDQDVPNDQPRKIYFHGNKINIDAAVNRVSDLVQTAPILASANASSGKGLTSTIVDCPVSLVGLLIGKRGWTIKKIQQASGAQISINQSVREGLPRKIIVSGDESAVANALSLIDEVLRDKSLIGDVEGGPVHYDYGPGGPRGRPDSPHYDPRRHGGGSGTPTGRFPSPIGSPMMNSPAHSHGSHQDYPPAPSQLLQGYGSPRQGRAQSVQSMLSSQYDHMQQPPPQGSPHAQHSYGQGRYGNYSDGSGSDVAYSQSRHLPSSPQQSPHRQHQQFYQSQSQLLTSQYGAGALDSGGEDDPFGRGRTFSDRGGSEDVSPGGGVDQGSIGSPSPPGSGLLSHMMRGQGGVQMLQPRAEYQPAPPSDNSPYRGSPAQHSSVLNVAASEYPARGVAASPIEYVSATHARGLAKAAYGMPDGGMANSAGSEPRLPSYIGSPHMGSPHLGSPHMGSPHLGSPHMGSPQIGSPHMASPHTGSPHTGSPHKGSSHHRGLSDPLNSMPPINCQSDMYPGAVRGGDHVTDDSRAHMQYTTAGGGSVPYGNSSAPGQGQFDSANMHSGIYGADVGYAGAYGSHVDAAAPRPSESAMARETSRFESAFFVDGAPFLTGEDHNDHRIHAAERDIDKLLHCGSAESDGYADGGGDESVDK